MSVVSVVRTRRRVLLGSCCLGLALVSGCSSGASTEVTSDDLTGSAPPTMTSAPSSAATEPSGAGAPSASGPSGDARSGAPGDAGSGSAAADERPATSASVSGPVEPTVGPDRDQSQALDNLPGSRAGTCVPVGDDRDVRSGSFGAGPFDEARQGYWASYGEGRTIRLYFIPQHSASMPGLVLTGRNRDTGATLRQEQRMTADAESFRFYDLQVPVFSAGTWELRASAGADRGCWSVRLG